MRALNIPILLHEREGCRLVGKGGDRPSALAMMPADIKFIDREITAKNVLCSYDAFIGMALQKELPAEEVPLRIGIQSRDFRGREAHSEHLGAVRLGCECHGQSRKVYSRC